MADDGLLPAPHRTVCRDCLMWTQVDVGWSGYCNNPNSLFFGLWPAYDKSCSAFVSMQVPVMPFHRGSLEDALFDAYIMNQYQRITTIQHYAPMEART